MTEEQMDKEVVIKLTAFTGEFISRVQDADKAIKGMKADTAGIDKLMKEIASDFKQMSNIYQTINMKSISSDLTKGIADATKEYDKLAKSASKYMSKASGIQKVAKGSKDAAKAMSDAGKEAAKSTKDIEKAAGGANQNEGAKKSLEELKQENAHFVEQKKLVQEILEDQKLLAQEKAAYEASLNGSASGASGGSGLSAEIEKSTKDFVSLGTRLSNLHHNILVALGGSGKSGLKKAIDGAKASAQGIRLTDEELAERQKAKAELVKQENEELKEQEKLKKQILSDDEELAKATQLAARMDKAREAAAREIVKNKPSTAEIKARPNKSNPNEYQVPPEYESARAAVSGITDEVKRTTAQMEIATSAGRRFGDIYRNIRSKLNPAFAESERQVARLDARIADLTRQRADVANNVYHSAEWEDYTKRVHEARSAQNALAVEAQALSNMMQRSDLFDTEEAKQAKEQYIGVTNELRRWREEETKYANLKAKLNEGIGKAGTENPAYQALTAQIAALTRQRDMTRAAGSSLLGHIRKHTKRDAQKLTTILKNTYNKIKSFFSKVFHLSNSRSADRGLKRIANAFTRLWGMFRTRLKRRFISAVFEDAKNDMVQLAKAFPSMNDAISGVVNSAKALGAQLISILQPIITAVGPLVTKVLDAATVAADKIAQFSAKLFGQNQYGKATKGAYDFVKSMDETTSSVNSANNALTDYSSNLLGFDKLNQLQDVGDDSKASISAVDTDPVQDNAFNRWAEELKENWDNKDWRGFGTTLANGLNDAVDWINNQDWDALSGKVTGFISNIQEAFNGFIEAFKAEGVGHLIGHIGNLLIDAWDQLVKPVEDGGFDFKTLGQKIGTMLVTALQDIKWDKAGVAFGNTGNRLAEMFRGILETKFTDVEGDHTLGYGIGKAISTFISNALKTINTDDWAAIIADLFNNLLDILIQIFSSGPDLGSKIAEILNKSLKKIESSKLGEAISGLSRTFNAIIEGINWGDVVAKLWEAFSHVDFWSVAKSIFYIRIGKKAGSFFNNVLGGLFGSGTSAGSGIGSGLLGGLLGRLLGKGAGAGTGVAAGGGGGLLKGLVGKLGGFLGAHPLLGKGLGAAATVAALWGGNQIGRELSQQNIEEYHNFKESGRVLDADKWNDAQKVGAWLMATIDNVTGFFNISGKGVFDGFSESYGDAMRAQQEKASRRNEDSVNSEIAYQILNSYKNGLSREKLEERYGMTVADMNSRYGLNLAYDGQTSALTETINNNTSALQSTKVSNDASAQAMADAAAQMKSLVDSMSQSAETGQPVQLIIDGYKFGEFVLKQLGTLMHVRLATN